VTPAALGNATTGIDEVQAWQEEFYKDLHRIRWLTPARAARTMAGPSRFRSEMAMYAVVNHMKLSRSLDSNIIERMNSELMSDIGKMPGVTQGLCVQVADDGIVVVVVCESEDSLERVHQEVGLPWVRENLKPYLASTDRKVGPVIARPHNL
jgi:hypothetical protein